jgi:Protein of unknown function (DUF3618)
VAQVTPERQLKDEIVRLRHDIEQVRDELGGTLAALEDRASPKRIAERNKERARERIEGARRSAVAVWKSADKRVVGAGAALLAVLVVARLLRG